MITLGLIIRRCAIRQLASPAMASSFLRWQKCGSAE